VADCAAPLSAASLSNAAEVDGLMDEQDYGLISK
jgi:hypothetical protein